MNKKQRDKKRAQEHAKKTGMSYQAAHQQMFTLGDFFDGKQPGIPTEFLKDSLELVNAIRTGFVPGVYYLHDKSWRIQPPVPPPQLETPVILVVGGGRTIGGWLQGAEGLAHCFRFDVRGNPTSVGLRGVFVGAEVRVDETCLEGEILSCTLVDLPADLHLEGDRPGIQTSVRMPQDESAKQHYKAVREWIEIIGFVQEGIGESEPFTDPSRVR